MSQYQTAFYGLLGLVILVLGWGFLVVLIVSLVTGKNTEPGKAILGTIVIGSIMVWITAYVLKGDPWAQLVGMGGLVAGVGGCLAIIWVLLIFTGH